MLKMIALIGVDMAIAFTPLPTIAQTAPAASATRPPRGRTAARHAAPSKHEQGKG